MLNPRVLEKLIRHLSKDLKIAVRLDYSKNAIPKTDSTGTVTLPAWLDEKDAGRLLACVVHESGHGEFDLEDMEKIGLYSYEPIFALVMNVLNDVRIDVRRQKQYQGVHNLYREIWAWADQEFQTAPPPQPNNPNAPDNTLMNVLKGLLALATGLDVVAPGLTAEARKHPNWKAILDVLQTCPNKDGFLWKETLDVIALLQVPKQKGQGQGQGQGQAQQGQSGPQGQQGTGDPSSSNDPGDSPNDARPSKTLASELQRIDNKRTLNTINEKMDKLVENRDKQERRDGSHMDLRKEQSRLQNNLAKQMPHPSILRQSLQEILGGAGVGLHYNRDDRMEIHPANLNTLPLTKVNVDEYNRTSVQTALAKFFESTEEINGDPEIKTRIDSNNLHKLLTHPSEILIGEMLDEGEDTAIIILIDCSGSMNDGLDYRFDRGVVSKLALAARTLQTVLKSGKETNANRVRLGITLFSDSAVTFKEITPIQELKASDVSPTALQHKIRNMGGTNLQDGLEDCLKSLEDERARRKGVIVITDGQVPEFQARWIKESWPMDIAISIITLQSSGDYGYGIADPDLKELFKHVCSDDVTMPIALSESLTESVEGGD